VEHLAEQASFGGALRLVGYLFVCFIAYTCLDILAQNFKLARRGPRAAQIPSLLPFGEDSSPSTPKSRLLY
jgi:hypothetical protein